MTTAETHTALLKARSALQVEPFRRILGSAADQIHFDDQGAARLDGVPIASTPAGRECVRVGRCVAVVKYVDYVNCFSVDDVLNALKKHDPVSLREHAQALAAETRWERSVPLLQHVVGVLVTLLVVWQLRAMEFHTVHVALAIALAISIALSGIGAAWKLAWHNDTVARIIEYADEIEQHRTSEPVGLFPDGN